MSSRSGGKAPCNQRRRWTSCATTLHKCGFNSEEGNYGSTLSVSPKSEALTKSRMLKSCTRRMVVCKSCAVVVATINTIVLRCSLLLVGVSMGIANRRSERTVSALSATRAAMRVGQRRAQDFFDRYARCTSKPLPPRNGLAVSRGATSEVVVLLF